MTEDDDTKMGRRSFGKIVGSVGAALVGGKGAFEAGRRIAQDRKDRDPDVEPSDAQQVAYVTDARYVDTGPLDDTAWGLADQLNSLKSLGDSILGQTSGDLGSSEINQYQGDAANTGYVSSPSLADVNEFDGTTLLKEDTGEGYIAYTENGLIHTNQNKLFSRDEDGNEVWSNGNGATAFGPAVTQNGDVVSSDKFNIYTIDENGVKAKNQEFANDKATILVRDNGNILVNSPAAMGELDPDTLEPVDTIETTLSTGDGAIPRTLSVADDRYLLYANGGTVVSYDLEEDDTVFERGLPGTALGAQGTAADQDTFYVANKLGEYFGIDVESGDVNGSVEVGPDLSAFSSPVVHEDGTVTFSGTEVVNVDPDDFSENWRSNPPGGVTTTSAVNDTFLRASGAGFQALDMNNNGEIIDTVFEESRVVAGMATGNSLAAIVDNSDLYRVDLTDYQSERPPQELVGVESVDFQPDEITIGESTTYTVTLESNSGARDSIAADVTVAFGQDDTDSEFTFEETVPPGEQVQTELTVPTSRAEEDGFERINDSAVRADVNFENDSHPDREEVLGGAVVESANRTDS